jgi:hypothetical protein
MILDYITRNYSRLISRWLLAWMGLRAKSLPCDA